MAGGSHLVNPSRVSQVDGRLPTSLEDRQPGGRCTLMPSLRSETPRPVIARDLMGAAPLRASRPFEYSIRTFHRRWRA